MLESETFIEFSQLKLTFQKLPPKRILIISILLKRILRTTLSYPWAYEQPPS